MHNAWAFISFVPQTSTRRSKVPRCNHQPIPPQRKRNEWTKHKPKSNQTKLEQDRTEQNRAECNKTKQQSKKSKTKKENLSFPTPTAVHLHNPSQPSPAHSPNTNKTPYRAVLCCAGLKQQEREHHKNKTQLKVGGEMVMVKGIYRIEKPHPFRPHPNLPAHHPPASNTASQ